jgi:hypothetical protein
MLRDNRICSVEYINGLLDHGELAGLDDDDHHSTIRTFGDPDTNGSWRIEVVGTKLEFKKRESGIWVTKGAITP